MNKTKIKDKAKHLRTYRKIHRFSASLFFIFFLFIAISGSLLGWKKHSNGLLLSENKTGSTTDLKQWLSLDSLQSIALLKHQDLMLEKGNINRMEIRPEDGIIKFTFNNNYLGLQIDGANGEILNIESRYSDIIEQIHDGSIIDHFFNFTNGTFKVIYTSLMGLGLLLFTITGYWLWAGPRKIKRNLGS